MCMHRVCKPGERQGSAGVGERHAAAKAAANLPGHPQRPAPECALLASHLVQLIASTSCYLLAHHLMQVHPTTVGMLKWSASHWSILHARGLLCVRC